MLNSVLNAVLISCPSFALNVDIVSQEWKSSALIVERKDNQGTKSLI
jgi:hypothetical protein